MALIWLLPAVFLVVYSILRSLQSYSRLSQFKGPKIAAWTDFWYLRLTTSGKAHSLLGDLIDEYGELCRVAPNILLTSDEELIRKMNAVRTEYAKSSWYQAFKLDGTDHNILSVTDHGGHMTLRNQLASGYAGTGNPKFESDIDSIVLDLFNLIDSKYLSKGSDLKKCDLGSVLQYFTLDVVTLLSLGKPFGYVKQDQDVYEYVQTMFDNFPVMTMMTGYPPLVRFMNHPSIQKFLVPSVKDRVGLGKVKGIAFDIVRERFAQKSSNQPAKPDMMDSFIKNGLSESQIADNTLVQFLAGSDTTTSVLRSGLISIMSNPQVCARLQAECDEVSKEITRDQVISYQRATQMPYLDACVKECLRYTPGATGLLPRVVPKGGDTYNGKHIPEGTVIGLAQWNMTRKSKVYGEDCEVFRPERWLDASPEKLAKMEKLHELLFMTGRHRCLGERIAKFELYKLMFEMIRRYDLASLNPMQPIDVSVNYGLWQQRGMWCRIEARP